MPAGQIPSTGALPAPRAPHLPRVVLWTVATMAVVQFLQWTVVLPEDVQSLLGFRRGDLDLGRWWTALSYPFVHQDSSLLLLNAYAFAIFGSRLERSWGAQRFVAFLVLASIGGWILHLLFGGEGVLLGASSAAFATLGAYAIRWGNDVHGVMGGFEVRGRWLTVFVGALILLVGLRETAGGGVGFLAHLGGLSAAWLFVRATPVMLVERFREGVSALPDEPPDDQPPRAVPRTLPRSRSRDRDTIDDVVSRSNAASARRAPRQQATAEPPDAPPTIDSILDKISAEGIDRLTDDERRVLDDHSRRLRDG